MTIVPFNPWPFIISALMIKNSYTGSGEYIDSIDITPPKWYHKVGWFFIDAFLICWLLCFIIIWPIIFNVWHLEDRIFHGRIIVSPQKTALYQKDHYLPKTCSMEALQKKEKEFCDLIITRIKKESDKKEIIGTLTIPEIIFRSKQRDWITSVYCTIWFSYNKNKIIYSTIGIFPYEFDKTSAYTTYNYKVDEIKNDYAILSLGMFLMEKHTFDIQITSAK